MFTDNRRRVGSEKEEIASKYLIKKGYEIIDRNYKVRTAEIDIIAKKDNILCFVEVKYRLNNSAGDPLEAVTVGKQKKISAASIFYMNHKGINPYDTFIRYDVIGIDGDNNITHIENAFDYIK